jgi:ubiquinone/menaquinone biosynthesis C-methylase UbiE
LSTWHHSKLDQFEADVVGNEGYLYSTNARLSSQLANRRCTDSVLAMTDFRGRRVIDVGCGDGTYTVELLALGEPASIHGVDVVQQAVVVAGRKTDDPRISFVVGSATELPYPDDSFDIALVRGVLHHMPDAQAALRQALRVAPIVVVLEPNGYNPVLKLFERFHPYHIAHGEMSYAPKTLDRWMRQLGATVERRTWAGLVPMFCPDWCAVALKKIEPGFERIPLARAAGCAVYVLAARRATTGASSASSDRGPRRAGATWPGRR